MSRRSAVLNVMIEAAEKAGRGLVRDFGEVENLQVSKKGPGDFVSTADHKAEKTIKGILEKARPSYGFLMEESGASKGADPSFRWIVDPLDGTTNFLHGIPHWSISIALEKDKEIIAGVIYDPVKDELFYAEKGTGAFSNKKRLRVSSRSELDQTVLLGIGGARMGDKNYETYMAELDAISASVPCTRRLGSAALDLAYVAAGRYEGFWERHLNAWDVAAGALLIKEAGGYVSDMTGGKDYIHGGSIVGANPDIHAALVKKFKNIPAPAKKAASASSGG